MTEKPLPVTATMYDVVKTIESSRRRIAIVTSKDGMLLGTLTDGDVRRCILAGGDMKTLATRAMNSEPVTAQINSPSDHIMDLMKRANVMTIPLVDEQGRFVKLVHLFDLDEKTEAPGKARFAAAVIMAGGEGARLHPLTKSIPKPMIEIDGIPLLERQVRGLAEAGVKLCYLSVNYLSQVIEDYFKDGSEFGLTIRYLREENKMGTAGALSLLEEKPKGTLLVMNGDILTNSNFGSLYTYHLGHKAAVTVAAVEHHVQIPYGVIQSEGALVKGIEEKPSQRFLCNAGIYALSPEALKLIPQNFYNMTDLIRDCISGNKVVSVFPIHEFWSDIGTLADLEKARKLFSKIKESA
ncbi:MAG: nucleotidyltransferase family protein [Alphaproteobacteria bacterium]|nr:nucleotidyltransferase family protein [Alphaproteobacteria bacterium]